MPLGWKDGGICAGSAGRVYMKKQEKIDLIALGIRKTQLLRMYFRYDENYFYYYPNAVNERLILAQEEDDFQLDGYHIRRISDLKKAEIKDDLCPEINRWKGITGKICNPGIDLSSWQRIFESTQLKNTCVIVENEAERDFYIGYIKSASARCVSLYYFGANGQFETDPVDIPYSKITHVAWDTRYSTTWHQYLTAQAMLPDFDALAASEKIYYVMAEAVPAQNSEERTQFGGAEISIWVKAASKKEALKKARAHIRAEGWSFVHTDDLYAAKRDDFDDPAFLACYDEAKADGLSSIFYTWPADQ